LRNDAAVWLAVGLASGLAGELALGLATPLALGFAGNASLRYAIATALSAKAGTWPLNSTGFLKWAYGAEIIRISGNAFQIRHNEQRDWLIDSLPTTPRA
jgi:hypothetical protein